MNSAQLTGALALALVSLPAMSQEVRRQFTYSADLMGDGGNESIVLAIQGAAIDKPFKWSLTVTDRKNRVLFKVEEDDAWIDEAYGDPNYMSGCSGYEQCKRRYYFEDKPKELSNCLKRGETKRLAASLGFDNSSAAARYFLEERKTPSAVIDTVLKELRSTLASTRTLSLCYQEHKEDHGKFLVWSRSVGDFVPYYVP